MTTAVTFPAVATAPPSGNPENNWVHISIKAPNGAILDVRAEDGDTLRALVDGAVGVGTYADQVERPFQALVSQQMVEQQAVQNLQAAGVVRQLPGTQAPTQQYRDQQPRPEPIQLGTDPLTGASITLYPEGKYGPYVKDSAGTIASLPKGMHPSQCTVTDASEALVRKRAYKAQQG